MSSIGRVCSGARGVLVSMYVSVHGGMGSRQVGMCATSHLPTHPGPKPMWGRALRLFDCICSSPLAWGGTQFCSECVG